MSGARLPGAPEHDRVVCHVDADCFYAACERLREPELRGEPVVVGMGYEPGDEAGAVATASYDAREYGVESAQAISEALELLPRAADADETGDDSAVGHYRPVDMAYYESVAEEVRSILYGEADVVREVSIDEAYLDVTDTAGWADAEPLAERLKERVDCEVGVTVSVGVAPTMSAAKVASDHDKPDGLVVVDPGSVREFLAPLDVEELHGVGPVTARELRGMGIETAGDLAAADPHDLGERFGERGREIHRQARGRDEREVTPVGDPKSLSSESALPETDDDERKREVVRGLAADVSERASATDALYATIGIKVVTPPYDVHTRARSLSGPVDDPDLVERVALDLLGEFEGETVRKLGVRVSNLSFSERDQADLAGWEDASGDGKTATREGDGDDQETTTLAEWAEDADTGPGESQASLSDFGSSDGLERPRPEGDP